MRTYLEWLLEKRECVEHRENMHEGNAGAQA